MHAPVLQIHRKEKAMKILLCFLKTLLAGFVAIIIISMALCFYSITPVHVKNSRGNTDYVWESNSWWVSMTEGVSFGRYDKAGYNNKKVIEDPDIIILGSSHMEATNVLQHETTSYLLGEKLKEKYTVYNLGISGHNFEKVCQYLPVNLDLYSESSKVVIIETSNVNITEDAVERILNNNVKYTESQTSSLMIFLQKIPFLRRLYHQMEGGLLDVFLPSSSKTDTPKQAEAEIQIDETIDQAPYDNLFQYLQSLEEKYNTQIIIFYHPTETLNKDGTISFPNDEHKNIFSKTAKNHEITFIDMTQTFEEMYDTDHHVPHGFITGQIGSGHLNRYGHRAIADSLYDAISTLEKENLICN